MAKASATTHTAVTAAVIWVLAAVAYIALAGSMSADELMAACACAAATAGWSMVVRGESGQPLVFEASALATARRAVLHTPRATLLIARSLIAALENRRLGGVRRSHFEHGPREDPKARGRRAVDVLAASLAPDGYVLRTPVGRDEIIVHNAPADVQA